MTTCEPSNHQMACSITLKDGAGALNDYVQSSFHEAFPKYSDVTRLKSKSFRPKVSALRSTVPICWSTGAENESIFSAAAPGEGRQEKDIRYIVDDPASTYRDIRRTGLLIRSSDVDEKQSQYRQEFGPKFSVPDRFIAPTHVPLWTKSAFTDKSVYRSDYQPRQPTQEGQKNLLVRASVAIEGDARSPLGGEERREREREEAGKETHAPENLLPALESSTTYKENFKKHSDSYSSGIIRGRKMTYPERSKRNVEIGTKDLVNELTRGSEATSYNTTFSAPPSLSGLAAAGLRSPGVAGQGGRYNPNLISTGSVTPTSFSRPEFCFRRRKHNLEGRVISAEGTGPANLPGLKGTLAERMRNANVWPYLEHRGGCFYKAH